MGAPDAYARVANSTVVQACPSQVSDEEDVDDAESDLSISSPETMMQDLANAKTASIKCDHHIPQAFGHPHVEAAFQAQYTETRLKYITCAYVAAFFYFFGRLVEGLHATQQAWNVPVSIPLGLCLIFLLASLGLLCSRTKLHECHHLVQTFSNVTTVLLLTTGSGLTLLCNLNGGPVNPFGTAYISGLSLGCGTLAMVHAEAALWTFLFNAVFAVAVCSHCA